LRGLPLEPDIFRRSLALNWRLGGLDPWGYHLFNLAVHIGAAIALFAIVRRTLLAEPLRGLLGRDSWPLALTVALLWLVHPLQTESVTYIVQRREAMMGLCFLLTLYAVIRGAASRGAPSLSAGRNPGGWHAHAAVRVGMPAASARACPGKDGLGMPPSPESLGAHVSPWWPAWYAAAIFFCWLGMGVKAVMAVAPLVVLMYDRTFLAGSFRGALGRRWFLYLGLALTWWAILPGSQARMVASGMGVPGTDITTVSYLRSEFAVVTHYLRLCFWPTGLCLDYDWPVAKTWTGVLPQVVFIGALVGLTLWALVRRPAAGFLGAWFFGILAPTSSFITIPLLAFEHRMYLSLAAVAALVVLAGYLIAGRLLARLVAQAGRRRRAGWVLAGMAVLGLAAALGCLTARRNEDYRTGVSIWGDTVRKRPDNARAHGNLGLALYRAGDIGGSIDEFNRAMALGWNTAEAFYNRGVAWQARGRTDLAIRDYDRAIQLRAGYAEAWSNRGTAWQARGENEKAVGDFTCAIRLKPRLADAWYNRGNAFFAEGRLDRAVEDYTRAVELRPDFAEAWNNRGAANLQRQQFGPAIADCTRAIELDRGLARAYRNRAVSYWASGAYDKAWADVEACEKLGYAVDAALLQDLSAAAPRPR
jgi:tetratricopeptide (TPR) repeat protein